MYRNVTEGNYSSTILPNRIPRFWLNIEVDPDGGFLDFNTYIPLTYDNWNPDMSRSINPEVLNVLVMNTNSGLWEISAVYVEEIGVMCEFGKLSNTSEYFKTLK